MSDEAGLLLAIREQPSDDLPRMAWADWLDEQGRSERAELVRLQLALARGDESGRTREQALLAEHGQRWLDEELPGFKLRTTHEWWELAESRKGYAAFRRGFPNVFFVPLSSWNTLREHHQRFPLARVQLTGSVVVYWEGTWLVSDNPLALDHLPRELADCMPTEPEEFEHGLVAWGFDSEAAGNAAISRACTLYASGDAIHPCCWPWSGDLESVR